MSPGQTFYILDNGIKGVEKNRLESQHGILLEMAKTRFPPNIAAYLATLDRAPAIADIGTGTGVWLRDLATLVPHGSRLDGYDIDTSKFPSPAQLPSNVRLTYGDTLKPFPTELLGTYDLVHVRLLMYGLKADQWEAAAENLRTLLRPGGFLMWEDIGLPSWQCLPMTEHFMKWFNAEVRYAASIGRDVMSPLHLQDQFESAGFVNCAQQEFSSYGGSMELQKMASKALIAVGSQSLHGIVDRGGFEWVRSHEEVDQLMNTIVTDMNNGVTQIGCTLHRVVGQNPEQ